jgi:hypothetical protein
LFSLGLLGISDWLHASKEWEHIIKTLGSNIVVVGDSSRAARTRLMPEDEDECNDGAGFFADVSADASESTIRNGKLRFFLVLSVEMTSCSLEMESEGVRVDGNPRESSW